MPRRRNQADRNKIAKSFYNSKLRYNSSLRRLCSDRHVLDDVIDSWKAEERLKGSPILGVSRSDIIFSLKGRWKLIDSKVANENIIIWKEDVSDGHDINNKLHGARVPTIIVVDAAVDKSTRIARTVERIQKHRKELESNRNGIVISNIEWEDNMVFRLGVRITQEVFIRNESDIDVLCTIQDDAARSRGVILEGETRVNLLSRSSHIIRISFLPRMLGVTKSLLTFDFAPVDFDEGDSIDDAFSIVRYISIRAGDPDDYDIIKPIAPYIKKQHRRGDEDKFSNPVRENSASVGAMVPFIRPLGQYKIPKDFTRFLSKEAIRKIHEMYGSELLGRDVKIDYPSYLTMDNYAKCLQHLWWVEESQMHVDIRAYDLVDVMLMKEGRRYFKLHIPGLAESRPSVLKGDKILICVNNERRSNNRFEGIVHRTTQEHAIIDFPHSFSGVFIAGLRVDVRFTFSRTTLRTSHQALSVMTPNGENLLQRTMLFPQCEDVKENPLNSRIMRTSQLNFFNRTLNREQQMAVFGIVQSVARPAPYLIYGPPG
jgi:helicase MOV-10